MVLQPSIFTDKLDEGNGFAGQEPHRSLAAMDEVRSAHAVAGLCYAGQGYLQPASTGDIGDYADGDPTGGACAAAAAAAATAAGGSAVAGAGAVVDDHACAGGPLFTDYAAVAGDASVAAGDCAGGGFGAGAGEVSVQGTANTTWPDDFIDLASPGAHRSCLPPRIPHPLAATEPPSGPARNQHGRWQFIYYTSTPLL